MNILAIEASGLTAGTALVTTDGTPEGTTLVAENSLRYKKTHSQTLVPLMDQLKQWTELDLQTLDAIAITSGPGSFTGLRIGAATAKGMGLALDIPIIPVPTLDSLAYNVYGTDALVCPMMDARRGQVYTGIYEEKDRPVTLRAGCAVPVADILGDLNERGRQVILVGDGVSAYREEIRRRLSVSYFAAPAHLSEQRAASAAVLAAYLWGTEGGRCLVNADDFRPEYLRKSQAERQMEAARKEGKLSALAAGNLVKEERKEGLHDSADL